MRLFSKFTDREKELFTKTMNHTVSDLIKRDDFILSSYTCEEDMLTDFYKYLIHEKINLSLSLPPFLTGRVSLHEFTSNQHEKEVKQHLWQSFKNLYQEQTLAESLSVSISLPFDQKVIPLNPKRYIGSRFWNEEFNPLEKEVLLFIEKNQQTLIQVQTEDLTFCDKCSPEEDGATIISFHLPIVNKAETVELLMEYLPVPFSAEQAAEAVSRIETAPEYVLFDYKEEGVLHYRKDWVDTVGSELADLAQLSLEVTYCLDCGGWEISEYHL